MDFINLNGRRIKAAECNFNFSCMLSENGIELNQMLKKPLPTIRVYIAHCMGVDVEMAGEFIDQHIRNGGSFEDIMKVLSKKMDESGFFRALSESTTETIEQIEEVEAEKVTPMKKRKTTEA